MKFDSTKNARGQRLTAAMLRGHLDVGKYHDGGGMGLLLRVDDKSGKFWIQRITIKGKRCELGLGSFPVVSLAMAREQAMENKLSIRRGIDPLEEKKKIHADREVLTFANAVEDYMAIKEKEFRSEKHAKQWRATLDKYASPVIGKMDMDFVDERDVLRILEPIWTTKTETASRLRGRIEAIMSWAIVAGFRKGENPARWKGNLAELLPKPSKVATKRNFPTLSLADAPRWWLSLNEREGMAAEALRFACLTASRSGEVRGMVWEEVDLKKRLWTIPAQRMKNGKLHREPLSDAAFEILERLPRLGTADQESMAQSNVFFAARGGALSDMTLSSVMRRIQSTEEKAGNLGFLDQRSNRPAVPHGLRSTFRDWAAEEGIDHRLAELALSHWISSEVERAYRRTDQIEQRRDVMKRWSEFLIGKSNH
tara:strand:+ start:250 stop:1524 length:1275 start_codon:yes stop_codon:yes gene_type:complete